MNILPDFAEISSLSPEEFTIWDTAEMMNDAMDSVVASVNLIVKNTFQQVMW